MAAQFKFLKSELDELIANCGFTDEEIKIINYKRRGFSVGQIANELDFCERTVIRKTNSAVNKIIRYKATKKPRSN